MFGFLAEQAVDPQLEIWERFARMSGQRSDLGYTALILQNVTLLLVPTAVSDKLYDVAEALVGKLDVNTYTAWLRRGDIDVLRLVGHLDHVLKPRIICEAMHGSAPCHSDPM